MPLALVETSHCNVDLKPSPIKPHWIIEGNPEAREHVLSTSACGTTKTIIWSCTEGKFNWYYDVDETIMILEGSIVLESDGMPPRRFGAGDVILFRDGAQVKWHVEGHVRKLAFFRQTIPFGLGFGVRAINKLRQILFPPGGRPSARQRGSVQSSDSTAKATYDVAPTRLPLRRETHNVN